MGKKISQLPSETAPTGSDKVPLVDNETNTTKYTTITEMLENVDFPPGSVGTSQLADDSVTAAKIDWASTGANGGIWWEELGRNSLLSAGDTLTLTSFSARKHLKIYLTMIPTGGSINIALRFNSDTGSNYAFRRSVNGAADGSGTSQAYAFLDLGGASNQLTFIEIDCLNIATQEKIVSAHVSGANTAGAGNAPERAEWVDKWANTTDQITRIDVINQAGTGDFAIGSEIIVLGHN